MGWLSDFRPIAKSLLQNQRVVAFAFFFTEYTGSEFVTIGFFDP
jgi:hypothetical protein